MNGSRTKAGVGLAVVAAVVLSLALTVKDTAMTDDVDFYVGAAVQYRNWFGELSAHGARALDRDVIDRYWQYNREHPPVAKLCMAAGLWLFHEKLHLAGVVNGARQGVVFLAALLCWLLFSLAWDAYGPVAGVAAPLFLFTMPRFFFHSHVETLDVAVAATYFLTIYAFFRGRKSTGWAIFTGVAWGIAISTKLNAFFVVLPILVFWLAAERRGFGWTRRPDRVAIPRVPLSLVSMLALGPAVHYALWPWIWHDAFDRYGRYLNFHYRHYGILFYYFGRIYEKPFAPWHAPFVMTGITTPLVVLALALGGIYLAGRELRPILHPGGLLGSCARAVRGLAHRAGGGPEGQGPNGAPDGKPAAAPAAGAWPAAIAGAEDRRDLAALVLLNLFFTIGIVAFPNNPKYGGVKLFLPFLPFLALAAAAFLQWIGDRASALGGGRGPRTAIGALLVVLAVFPGALSLARIHPYQLSYYNALVGGLPGAVRVGFERQYYDLFYIELIRWLNGNLGPRARVFFAPNNKEYVRAAPYYKQDGILRGDIEIAADEARADFYVLTHERRWPHYPDLAKRFASRAPVHELVVEGVPLLSVYRMR